MLSMLKGNVEAYWLKIFEERFETVKAKDPWCGCSLIPSTQRDEGDRDLASKDGYLQPTHVLTLSPQGQFGNVVALYPRPLHPISSTFMLDRTEIQY